jgi:MFS family permease
VNTDSGFSLSAMVIAQVAIAMAVMTVPVLAPQIAADIEIEASQVGLYSATVFVGAIVFTSVAGSVIARHGSIRTTQIAMVLGAAGLLLALGGWLPALLIGAFAAGMGYGVATPAASHLLARLSRPVCQLADFFSASRFRGSPMLMAGPGVSRRL